MELNRAVLHQCLISRQREADSSAKTGTVLPCTPTTETQEQRDMGTGPRGLTDTLARSREKLAFFLPPNTVASHDVPMNACWGHTGVGHKLKNVPSEQHVRDPLLHSTRSHISGHIVQKDCP